MIQAICPVYRVIHAANNTFVLSFISPEIGHKVRAGQFINIKTDPGSEPLLRRPYSVYRTHDDFVEIIFNIVGKGSSALGKKQAGDLIDVLGPLGVPFSLDKDDFDTGILVGGGLGVAPLPMARQELLQNHKAVMTFLGARSSDLLVETYLPYAHVSTDDGSKGYHGDIVELLRVNYEGFENMRPKIFACGPTKMLRAVASYALEKHVPCEVSLEGPMACGIGICQGCPVELIDAQRKYGLMCKDGPVFDITKIRI